MFHIYRESSPFFNFHSVTPPPQSLYQTLSRHLNIYIFCFNISSFAMKMHTGFYSNNTKYTNARNKHNAYNTRMEIKPTLLKINKRFWGNSNVEIKLTVHSSIKISNKRLIFLLVIAFLFRVDRYTLLHASMFIKS